jgi:hypothetical protein
VNPEDNHPVVLEATLQWKDLSESEQITFLNGLRVNNLSEFIMGCDVTLPSMFVICFPLHQLQPHQPPEAQGQVRVFVEPKIQTPVTVQN